MNVDDFFHELSIAAAGYLEAFQIKYGRTPTMQEIDSYTDGILCMLLIMTEMNEDAAAVVTAKLADSMQVACNTTSEYKQWLKEG